MTFLDKMQDCIRNEVYHFKVLRQDLVYAIRKSYSKDSENSHQRTASCILLLKMDKSQSASCYSVPEAQNIKIHVVGSFDIFENTSTVVK